MALRAELKYNERLDISDGFEDDGFFRNNALAKQVSVFMVKGLFSNWSFIFNYFVSEKGLTGDCISNIILENLKNLMNLGVTVRAIVCDQGSGNRKAFNNFGVTPVTQFLLLGEQKIFCLYDFPHLIKSLRNGLLKDDLKTPDGIVSFKVIRELWEREQSLTTKLCPKWTRQHVDPKNFEKMKVSLATQVLSRTSSAAIKTVVATGGFSTCNNDTALATARFIEKIDRIFDCMNSGNLCADNFYRCAVQLNNTPYNYIGYFLSYLENVEFLKSKQVHFLRGMKISLNAVIQLANEVLNDKMFFLMTKALNQDRLENTFSVVRQRGGFNRNPSVAEVNHTIAKIMCVNLIQATSSANCESTTEAVLEDNFLSVDAVVEEETAQQEIENCAVTEEMAVENCIMRDIDIEKPSEDALPSMRYFSGYVGHKILPKLGCEKCLREIRKPEEMLTTPTELFLFYKNYSNKTDFGSLWAPSDPFFDVCKLHMSIFSAVFKTNFF